jgi:hypothetical protein
MAIPDFKMDIVDDSFKSLDYEIEPFNSPLEVDLWISQGYGNKFTGAMCDMRKPQPTWVSDFVEHFEILGWKNVGTSFYRMDTGTVLPLHSDTYKRYIALHNLQGNESSIHRAIIFLEDWASGHYLEINGRGITNWTAGDVYTWNYDAPHMAANLGLTPRYTLQITGHK